MFEKRYHTVPNTEGWHWYYICTDNYEWDDIFLTAGINMPKTILQGIKSYHNANNTRGLTHKEEEV